MGEKLQLSFESEISRNVSKVRENGKGYLCLNSHAEDIDRLGDEGKRVIEDNTNRYYI